jgi:hypothetical protein
MRIARRTGAAVCIALMVLAGVAYGSLGLTGRVLRSGELVGMKPSGPVQPIKTASAWVAHEGLSRSAQTAEIARLRMLGFVAGVDENLITSGNQSRYGLSLVEQFGSASSAKAELAQVSTANGPWTYFGVADIPGARGFESLSGSGSGRNVGFADGSFFYLVGDGWTGSANNAVSRSRLATVALVLYRRVHSK